MAPVASALSLEQVHGRFNWLRGIQMILDSGVSRLSVRGTSPKRQCESCRVAHRVVDRHSQDSEGFTDEDVLVIGGPVSGGLIIVPRSHVGGLEELPIPQRAKLLAAVRRAAVSVRKENPWSTPRIVARANLPASEGHMTFHVLP